MVPVTVIIVSAMETTVSLSDMPPCLWAFGFRSLILIFYGALVALETLLLLQQLRSRFPVHGAETRLASGLPASPAVAQGENGGRCS